MFTSDWFTPRIVWLESIVWCAWCAWCGLCVICCFFWITDELQEENNSNIINNNLFILYTCMSWLMIWWSLNFHMLFYLYLDCHPCLIYKNRAHFRVLILMKKQSHVLRGFWAISSKSFLCLSGIGLIRHQK